MNNNTMGSTFQQIKKKFLIFLSAAVFIAAAGIALTSIFISYQIEKYAGKYSGRKIKVDWVYANPFTGYVHFNNLKIYELKNLSTEQAGDSIFLSARGLSVNIAMLKLPFRKYEISKITLDHPRGIAIQNKEHLNFDDLITRFSVKRDSNAINAPVHFNILRIKIIEGEFHYLEELIPINYFIKHVNLESKGKRWDADSITAQFSFLQGAGTGSVKGDFTINVKDRNYRYAIVVHEFDLQIIQQYLRDLTNYGSFSASLDAEIESAGNFNDQEAVTTKGTLSITDFHLGKNPEDDYLSFDKFTLAIIELSPKNFTYFYDSVFLINPYFKYERYDYLDNLQRMFGVEGSNLVAADANPSKFNLVIELARYVKILSRNFFKSDFRINQLAVTNGDIKFNDFSLSEKFSVNLSPISITADSIHKDHERSTFSLQSGIKPYGNLYITLSVNPKDTSEFDMQYKLEKLPLTLFNPYIITYTSFPFDRGTVELSGAWKVREGIIKSNNRLTVIDPRVTTRVGNNDTKWIPLPLVMTLIRERGNVIDYKIPITGNMNDPNFQLHDVLFDFLKNVLIKPATIPYDLQVKHVEAEIEKSLTWTWPMRTSSILADQDKFIQRMADFLAENPEEIITVYPHQYAIKEREHILFYEAKKNYFLRTTNKSKQSFSKEDSEKVDRQSIRSPPFVDYLNKQISDSLIFTLQEKCTFLFDSAYIDRQFEQLNNDRVNAFMLVFKKRGVEKQIKFNTGTNVIPYNGFSFYKIEYSGELPKSLNKAYRQMNELNSDALRRNYRKARAEIITVL